MCHPDSSCMGTSSTNWATKPLQEQGNLIKQVLLSTKELATQKGVKKFDHILKYN